MSENHDQGFCYGCQKPPAECTCERDDGDYFTLVFRGDIRTFKGNPLKTETPFGIPVAASVGDALERIAELEG